MSLMASAHASSDAPCLVSKGNGNAIAAGITGAGSILACVATVVGAPICVAGTLIALVIVLDSPSVCDSEDSLEPEDPEDPIEPVLPMDPIEPVEPVEPSEPTCGNGVCDAGETYGTCALDVTGLLPDTVAACPGLAQDRCECWTKPTYYTLSGHPCLDTEFDCRNGCPTADPCTLRTCLAACKRDARSCMESDSDCAASAFMECLDPAIEAADADAVEACSL
jgi:hypothetical protein